MKNSKKVTEYHFIDVNDPERYKKIKVSKACNLCRKRKSKCDLGVPGTGSCSNCKKTNNRCIFSEKTIRKNNSIEQFSKKYQQNNPNFSIDNQGLCAFERELPPCSQMSLPTMSNTNLVENIQLKSELFDIYFTCIHPFYPVLDSHHILQALKYNPDTLLPALKYIIMALALQFNSSIAPDNRVTTANFYYHYSLSQMDYTSSLENIQILLLMYKYEETITPVGIPFSTPAIQHLKDAKIMLDHFSSSELSWTIQSEFICRASWIWFINLSFSNLADSRCKNLLSSSNPPSRMPCLTEFEQYDSTNLNIACNFIQLINITVIYTQTTCYISNNATLFSSTDHPILSKLVNQLRNWSNDLPNQLHSPLLSAHNVHSIDDSSKTTSFAIYLGLIHDTLCLLLDLHNSNFQAAQVAYNLAIKAHNLTLGHVPHTQFSRFASIQGSRLVVYGLTLALQSLHYDSQNNSNKGKLEPFTQMVIQILNQISVSPKISTAIQSIKQTPYYTQGEYPVTEEEYKLGNNRNSYGMSVSLDIPSRSEHNQDQNWDICQWEFEMPQNIDHYQDSRYGLSRDIKTPPTEQHFFPCVVQENEFQRKEKLTMLVTPMPFDIINPSFEFYPSKCYRRHGLL